MCMLRTNNYEYYEHECFDYAYYAYDYRAYYAHDDDAIRLVWPTWAVGALFRGAILNALTSTAYLFTSLPRH
jgi:hypothetical protein